MFEDSFMMCATDSLMENLNFVQVIAEVTSEIVSRDCKHHEGILKLWSSPIHYHHISKNIHCI